MTFNTAKVVTIQDFSADYRVPWIYPGIMEYGGMNMLFGVSRARKSTLNSYLFASALLGKPAFGVINVENRPRKALLIYGEGRHEAEMARLLRVTEALGASKADLLDKILTVGKNSGLSLNSEQDCNQVCAYCNQAGVDLVSIDSLAAHNSLDENSNNQVANLATNIARIQRDAPTRTVLLVHHQGKTGTEGRTVGQNARGGSALPAAMDNNLMLTKQLGTNNHTLSLEDKYHGGEPEYHLLFDPDTWLWSLRDRNNGDISLDDRIKALVAENPTWSISAVAKAAGGRYTEAFARAKAIMQ